MARLPFIDWVRGFAVVAMVLWHTGDAWLTPGLRDGQGWLLLRFVGGLAAPGFLFLAGTGAALSAREARDAAQRNRAFLKSAARGLEIVIIGYLLRYQAWVLDAGAIRELNKARAFLPIGCGYGLSVWAMRRLPEARNQALIVLFVALVLVVGGMLQVESVAEGRLARLLQVDVLQAIGMSLVLLAALERTLGLLQRPLMCLGLGLAVASLTHLSWSHMPGHLPVPVAAYFGRFEPAIKGLPTPSLFPLFPWFAYTCLGAGVGSWLRRHPEQSERSTVLLGVFGAALAVGVSEAHPVVANVLTLNAWLVHPARVAFRVGIILALFIVGWLWMDGGRGRLFRDYGQASLRIYWAHMLFAYGMFGTSLKRSVSYAEWAGLAVLLLAAMWLLTQGRMPGVLRRALQGQHT